MRRKIMSRALKMFLAMFFVFFSTLVFAENDKRIIFDNGSFSICPPLGWRTMVFPGLKYEVILGPEDGGFTANMTFADESYIGNLRDYVDLNLVQLERVFENCRIIERKDFRTNSGIAGECVITYTFQLNINLIQVYYFLPLGNNSYIVIACTVVEAASAKYIPLFEDSMRSFEL
jgi:hypothetical protein